MSDRTCSISLAKSNVRLIPNQSNGYLYIMDASILGSMLVYQEMNVISKELISILNYVSDTGIPMTIPLEGLSLNIATIHVGMSIISRVQFDMPSNLLIISLTKPVNNLQALLFHPLDKEFGFMIESLIKNRITKSNSSEQIITEDSMMNVLDTFSRVSQFYYGAARKLLGAEDLNSRPRSSGPIEHIRNPWIIDRKLDLPTSRRKEASVIDNNVDDVQFRHLIFIQGSVDDQRIDNWLKLFQCDKILSNYQSALEDVEFNSVTTHRIEKDVFRTDRNIEFYYPTITSIDDDLKLPHLKSLFEILCVYVSNNPSIDYVQGMNDIISPILYVMGDEEGAFKVFSRVMQSQSQYYVENSNYTKKQLEMLSGMLQVADYGLFDRITFSPENAQLFMCYRWLLLLFKREVGFYNFPKVLETIIAAPIRNYELFIALAMLLMNKKELESVGYRFDLTLQFFMENAEKYNVDDVLDLGDRLFRKFSSEPSIRADSRFKDLLVHKDPSCVDSENI